MAKPNLRGLDMMEFSAMTPERERRIAEAPADIPPAPSSYKPNRVAASLHPAVQHVRVSAVIDRSPEFRTFVLEPDCERGTEGLAYFEAGQYLCVEHDLPSGKVVRPYSIASSPKEALAGSYSITLERVPGGATSDHLWATWKEGTPLDVSAPQGQFTYEPIRDARQVVAVVGGSSITPVLSMAKAVAEGSEDFDLTVIWGTNTWALTACAQGELEELCARCPRVRLVNVLADEERPGCEHGFVDAALIKRHAPAEGPVSYFVCGPQAMQRALDDELPKLGVARKWIRREVFGEYQDPQSDPDYPEADPAPYRVTVHVLGETRTVACAADESLLAAMERQGIHAPARCRSGECGWCHSRLVAGKVHVPARVDGRREADKKFGYIHPCATFALSDLEIEVPPFAF